MSLNTGSIGLLVGCLAAAVAVYFLIIAVFSKTVKNRDEQVKVVARRALQTHERVMKKRKKDIANEPDRDNTLPDHREEDHPHPRIEAGGNRGPVP